MKMTTQIEQLIPQRAPFNMIDKVEENDGQFFASLTIVDGHLFVEDGLFTEPGIIEHMAQSVAALNAFQHSISGSDTAKPKIGFIGAIKNLDIAGLPKLNETIDTKMEITAQILGASIVQVQTFLKDEKIAAGEFKIFIQ